MLSKNGAGCEFLGHSAQEMREQTHGGDPRSVHFFHKAGLDYVSCSPFRVPIARLAAAQAALADRD